MSHSRLPAVIETGKMSKGSMALIVGLVVGSWSGAASVQAGVAPQFEDATLSAGITAVHHVLLSYRCAGAAWGDPNGDGCPDVYFTDSEGPNSLYINNCDGTFSISPDTAAVALPLALSAGGVFADYDNDGRQDLFVVIWGENRLFRNLGELGWIDVTAAAGVGDPGKGQSATWGDYDQDGDLDLYVTNNWFPGASDPLLTDALYENHGDGSFANVTDLLDPETLQRSGFSARFLDYDNDEDLDLYVTYDGEVGNVLWRNDGTGCDGWCFTDVSVSSGSERPAFSMGLDAEDYDEDGDLDFYYSSVDEMILLQNQTSQGSPTFLEVSIGAGVGLGAPYIGWGTVFFDYDNDGWLDLYLTTMNAEQEHANRLFHNLGDGTFEDVSDGSGVSQAGASIGVASADYDMDGLVDLVVGNWDDQFFLFRNTGGARNPSAGDWLEVRLKGRSPVNRDAIGARVVLTTTGKRTLMRWVDGGSGMGSGDQRILHFGLGEQGVESLQIAWPDGRSEQYGPVPANELLEFVYPWIFEDGFESGNTSAWN